MIRSQESIVVLRVLKELSDQIQALTNEVQVLKVLVTDIEINMSFHMPDSDSSESEVSQESGFNDMTEWDR